MKSNIKRIVAQSNGAAYIDKNGNIRYSEAYSKMKEVGKVKKLIKAEKVK